MRPHRASAKTGLGRSGRLQAGEEDYETLRLF